MNDNINSGIGVGDGYADNRILSVSDCQSILELISDFRRQIEEFKDGFDASINTFNSDATVQSFYASGNYGRDTQERLTQLGNGVGQILGALTSDANALIPRTKQVLEEQISLLSSSSGSGTGVGVMLDR